MNKQQLIELLKGYPDDMEIRISDSWNCARKLGFVNTGSCHDIIKDLTYVGSSDWSYDEKSDNTYKFIVLDMKD